MPRSSLLSFDTDLAWFDAIATRASRRRYDGEPVRPEALKSIEDACRRASALPGEGVRAVAVNAPPDGVFTGLVGNYGAAVTGAPAFAAFVAPNADSHLQVGYVGEAVVLAATAAGVNTCWVAGSFDPAGAARFVELSAGESVAAVTPLGYGTAKASGTERLLRAVIRHRSRKELERIAPGSAEWPEWARTAAEAARLAPSGKNGQPWRLRMDGDTLVVSCVTEGAYWTARMDCGIAALHAQVGAERAGVRGTWELLDRPDVARFVPKYTGVGRVSSMTR